MSVQEWRVPFYTRTWAYKQAVRDGVSHEDALIHAKNCNTESSRGDEYASLYHRARTCGATHAQAAEHSDACISARVAASEYAEADWRPEKRSRQTRFRATRFLRGSSASSASCSPDS